MTQNIEYDEKWFKNQYGRVLADKETDWLEYKKISKFSSKGLSRKSVVLEVGCGMGTLSYRLSECFDYVIGLDLSEFGCSKAKTLYRERNIKFIVANAQNMPFKSSVFDSVVISNVLEHLTDSETEIVQRESCRVMKAGGQLTVVQPVYVNRSVADKILLLLFASKRDRQIFYYMRKSLKAARKNNPQVDFHHLAKIGDPTHKRMYDEKLLTDELKKAGFGRFEFAKRKIFSILFFNNANLFRVYVNFYLKAPEMIRRMFLMEIGGWVRATKL